MHLFLCQIQGPLDGRGGKTVIIYLLLKIFIALEVFSQINTRERWLSVSSFMG